MVYTRKLHANQMHPNNFWVSLPSLDDAGGGVLDHTLAVYSSSRVNFMESRLRRGANNAWVVGIAAPDRCPCVTRTTKLANEAARGEDLLLIWEDCLPTVKDWLQHGMPSMLALDHCRLQLTGS